MDPILTVNYTKIKHECVYFIIFTSSHFDRELFKIGVTTNLTERLKSLRQEFKINGNYKLLLAIPVGSDEIEKDLLNAFQKRYPTLKINLSINNCNKTECFLYDDILLESVEAVKTEFSKQANKRYIENIDILVMGKQEAIDVDVAYTKPITWDLIDSIDSSHTNTHSDVEIKNYRLPNEYNDDMKKIESVQIIMLKSNGYVNISKMCKLNGKHMPCWFQAKDNQEYIKFLMEQLDMKYDELIIDKTKLRKEYRGRYAHRYITDKVARWISHDLAFKVSKIIDDYVNEENRRIIKEKDDKIANLLEEIKQLKIQNE